MRFPSSWCSTTKGDNRRRDLRTRVAQRCVARFLLGHVFFPACRLPARPATPRFNHWCDRSIPSPGSAYKWARRRRTDPCASRPPPWHQGWGSSTWDGRNNRFAPSPCRRPSPELRWACQQAITLLQAKERRTKSAPVIYSSLHATTFELLASIPSWSTAYSSLFWPASAKVTSWNSFSIPFCLTTRV